MFKLFILAVLISFGFLSSAESATQLLKTVKPSGGDYTSLEACMNANEQNLVTADQYFDVEIDGSWSSADTTAVTIHLYTTDATRYINIYTTTTARHNGTSQANSGGSNYRLIGTGSDGLTISNGYVTINGLEIAGWSKNYTDTSGIYLSDNDAFVYIVIKNNVIHDINLAIDRGGEGITIRARYSNNITVYNNIIYNIRLTGIHLNMSYGSSKVVTIDNNTIYYFDKISTAGYGIEILDPNSGNTDVKNNLIIAGSTGVCYSLGTKATTATNGSSDTTGDIDNMTAADLFVDVTADSEDLHLKAGADAIDVGTDLSAVFTTDIDGTTRPTGANTWDIGADEYVAAGGAAILQPIINIF